MFNVDTQGLARRWEEGAKEQRSQSRDTEPNNARHHGKEWVWENDRSR